MKFIFVIFIYTLSLLSSEQIAQSLENRTNIDLLAYGYKQEQNNHFYRAHLAYNKVCDNNDLDGCFYVALLSSRMLGYTFNRDNLRKANSFGYPYKAIEKWTKECDGSNTLSCFNLGRLYTSQNNTTKSKHFYKKACENGEMKACMALVGRYGYKKRESKPKFMKIYKKACEGGELNACYWLARSYEYNGHFKEANVIHEKACKEGSMKCCKSLALAYEWARGKEKDYLKAKKYYTKACNNGNMFACSTLYRVEGSLVAEDKTYVRTENLLEKACDMGLVSDCRSIEAYEKGCERGDRVSCDLMKNN